MQKAIIYITVLYFATLIGVAVGHAGISFPNPRGVECSATVSLNFCGKVAAPCGGDPVANATKITWGKLDVGVYQKEGHNGGGNYKINIAKSEKEAWTELVVANQESNKDGISLKFPVTIPTSFPSGSAVIQMIFDATAGGGDVYYSCADVIINNGVGQIAISTFVVALSLAALIF